jgi:hypothetical protein
VAIGVSQSATEGQWTFLEIVQRYCQDCGITSSSPVPLPETVQNQIGELKRAVDNCAEAWFDIQNSQWNWRFKRQEVQFETVLNKSEYTYQEIGIEAGGFGQFDIETFRCFPTGNIAAEMEIEFLPYEDWRHLYKLGAMRSSPSQPVHFTVTPYDGIALGPVPLGGYTILGDYYRGPVRMNVDEDVPDLPFKHSPMIIVYHAMNTYGYFEAAPEVVQAAREGYKRLWGKLLIDQLPDIGSAGALA